MSGNSWANMGQECIKCHINVYPHKQVRGGGREQAGAGGRRGTEWEKEQGSRWEQRSLPSGRRHRGAGGVYSRVFI